MNQDAVVLLTAAVTLGVVHTVLGPDHYLPFVALSRARKWSARKTAAITALCGVGHVLGSVALGMVGIAAGITLNRLQFIEGARGEIAAWLLIAFGVTYGAWGLIRAVRDRPHTHRHVHADGTYHAHEHRHRHDHAHVHEDTARRATAWTLFVVFVLGPCEPLIPLLMFPAAAHGPGVTAGVAAVFGLATVATMTAVVMLSSFGLAFVPLQRAGRYGHAVAGAVITLCGVAIQFGL